jgi:hypothetical protein
LAGFTPGQHTAFCRIIESFDIVEHIASGFGTRQVLAPVASFAFHLTEEALSRRVVSTGADGAHTADQVVAFQDSFVQYGLRVALSDIDETWEVAMVGKNLGDETTIFFANDLPGSAGSYVQSANRPRSFALQARYNF